MDRFAMTDPWIIPPPVAANMRLPLPIGAGLFSQGATGTAVVTRGISRNLQPRDAPSLTGGGDLNGTAAPILFHQAGTGGTQGQMPRKPCNPGNYCGVRISWTVTSLPGLVAWYDAQNTSSIVVNGSTVSQWNDQSGHGYNATQGTAANQPTYNATGLNGYPALMFNGSSQYLASGVPAGAFSSAIFAASVLTMVPGSTCSPWSRASAGQSAPYFIINWPGSWSGWLGDGSTETSYASQLTVPLSPTVFEGGWDKVNYSEWMNGTSVTTLSATNAYGDNSNSLNIGARQDLSNWFQGVCGELVMTTSIAAADRQKLEGYLAWKWGLQANLPAGHPYKVGPP
jgi:hypothetical protein